jgi:hypothetical protein
MPKLILDPTVLAEAGLDTYSPGDVVYLPIKATIIGDNGEVTGIKVEGLGPISDASATEFVDAYGENDNNDTAEKVDEAVSKAPLGENEPPASADETDSGEDLTTTGKEVAPADDSAAKQEEKILGYKRPKGKKTKMPKASDIFGGY